MSLPFFEFGFREHATKILNARLLPKTLANWVDFVSLKYIWNEIFDNDFIGPFESAVKDKTIVIYRLWISGLDPKL